MSTAEFNLAGYRRILEQALAGGYGFEFFGRIGQESGPRTCLLRHDIDSELLGCGSMLDVERDLGARATYFVMTRSTGYNLFCVESLAMVDRIFREGHRVGLHFMGELCENDSAEVLSDKVLREKVWLEREFGAEIDAVSFHQPSQAILDGQVTIPGLVNTYNKSQMGAYFYVSDTNMTWRHEHPVEIFSHHIYDRLQLLIHPIWWTLRPMTVEEKWVAVLRRNQDVMVAHWQARERTLRGIELAEKLKE